MHASKRVGVVVTCVLGALVPASIVTPVEAATVLYATGIGTGPNANVGGLYTLDPQTGVAALVSTFPAFVHGGGLAYDAATDTLYATGHNNLSQSTLFTIDRLTGTATEVGQTGTAQLQYGGLAIHPSTGVLYATGSNGFQSTGLFTVSKYTGAATLVGQAGSGCCRSLYGIGFRSDGVLFANGIDFYQQSAHSHLFTVDLATGAATDVGPHGVTVGRELAYSDLAFRADGTLLSLGSVSASASGLYSIDTATGQATLLGTTSIQFGADGGLAFAVDANCVSSGSWTPTGGMGTGRMAHTATLLPNGKVLVAGGRDTATSLDPVATAVLYDPSSGTFAPTGSMATPRFRHTATLLPNGKVLVAGGVTTGTGGVCIDSAELYDPAANNGAGAFSAAGSLNTFRADYTATLLANGKILMAGGSCSGGSSAEVYDPAANNGNGGSTSTGAMAAIRVGHTATLLPNGKVLVAGGMDTIQGAVLASAELYDPAANNGAGAFSGTGSLSAARQSHQATLLGGGGVLVTGGYDSAVLPVASAEIFDPATGTFVAGGALATARSAHSATGLPNGKTLIAGGLHAASGVPATFLDSSELFQEPANAFGPTGNLGDARGGHSATLLADGRVLAAGGQDLGGLLASAELYSTVCVPINTPVGSNVVVQPVDATTGQTPVTLTFSNVTQAGVTSLTTNGIGPAPPPNFVLGTGVYYHLTTTATFSGTVTVCIDYSGTTLAGTTTQPAFGHYDAAAAGWTTVTVTSWDQVNNIVCGDVSSLSPFALFVPANRSPEANAGPDRTIECGGTVRLDGSASSDPDGDSLTFEWTDAAGHLVGTTPVVTLALAPGVHAFSLTVRDGKGGADTDDVTIVVGDTRPPTLSLSLSPDLLWPASHRLVPVTATVNVSDACTASPVVTLVSIVSSEPDNARGDGDTPNDIQAATFGTDDRSFLLRAERAGGGGGRIYTVAYRARDAAGNETTASAQVRVAQRR